MLTHRWLGIVVGAVVAAWCLSGIVMMYVPYPEYSHADQLAGLAPLELTNCCRLPPQRELPSIGIDSFAVEMLGGEAVLRLVPARGASRTVDLASGTLVSEISSGRARAIAEAYAARTGIDADRIDRESLVRDQWTVQGRFDVHRPLYKFSADDPAGTEWYVSSHDGAVMQRTERSQRFWNWLGAVVHWLYPTILRQHPAVWSQTVIWLTVVALFLTGTGLYLGIKQFRGDAGGRHSPYRGWALWHHYAGLTFGIVTLTWVFSGAMSMNPWGALEGRSYATETARLRGAELYVSQLWPVLHALPAQSFGDEVVRLQGFRFRGALQIFAYDRDGGFERLDAELRPAPLPASALAAAAVEMRPGVAVRERGWLEQADAYYYEHHGERRFPVYRILYADGERIYLDARRGEIALAVDADRRWRRWLFNALHSGDFAAIARSRPFWDVFMLVLLAGTSVGAVTGTYMGLRRLLR